MGLCPITPPGKLGYATCVPHRPLDPILWKRLAHRASLFQHCGVQGDVHLPGGGKGQSPLSWFFHASASRPLPQQAEGDADAPELTWLRDAFRADDC